MRTPVAEQIFGHNKAPVEQVLETDFADLAKEVAEAAAKIRKHPTKIKNDTSFAAVGQIAIDARKLAQRVEEIRKGETSPLLEAQRSIKAHFDALAATLDDAVKPLKEAADNYTREKAAAERRRREEEAKTLREKEENERDKAANLSGAAAAKAEGRAEALAAQAEQAEAAGHRSVSDTVRTKVAGGGVATASTKWDFAIEDYDAIDLNKLRHLISREAVEAAIRSLVRTQKQHASLPGVKFFQDTRASFR